MQLRAKYGLAENSAVVTLIGTAYERKGPHVFLEAIKKLEKKYPGGLPDSFVFMMVGSINGPYLDRLQKRRDELNLHKVYIFHETKEVCDFFALSDIFICASFEESFPMVILLAMAFGLKIVSTDVFGIPEIISNAHEGYLIKPRDPVALSETIYSCRNDMEGSERMASNAYAKVCRVFNSGKLLERHLGLTKEVTLTFEERAGREALSIGSEYETVAFSSTGS